MMDNSQSQHFFRAFYELIIAFFKQINLTFELAKLEAKLAARTFIQLIILLFVLLFVVLSLLTWVSVLLFFIFKYFQFSDIVSVLFILGIHILLCCLLGMICFYKKKYLFFQETRKQIAKIH